MELAYDIIDALCIVFCCISTAIVVNEKASQTQKLLLVTNICGLFIVFGVDLQFHASSVSAALMAVKLTYLGKIFIMYYYLKFVAQFSEIKLPKIFYNVFLLINMVLVTILLYNHDGPKFYTYVSYTYIEPNDRIYLNLGNGLFYYVWLTETLISLTLYIIMSFREVVKAKSVRNKMWVVFLSALAPILAIVLNALKTDDILKFDATSLVIVFPELCMLIGIKKYGLLDTMEIAREKVLDENKDGLAIIEAKTRRVLYSNQVAKSIYPEFLKNHNEAAIDEILSMSEKVIEIDGKNYEVRVSEIKGKNQDKEVLGFMLWLFDMTFISQYTEEMIRLRQTKAGI